MTELRIWAEDRASGVPLEIMDHGAIRGVLAAIGIRYERWSTTHTLADDAEPAAVLSAYNAEIEGLKSAHGYQSADVIRIAKGTPNTAPLRSKFLDEHIHTEDEVRFFVEGAGAFYLRVEGKVYQVICGAGDLISVPANTKHWFDMGEHPHFTAIRLFTSPDGWVARFTGDAIAGRFPLYATAP